MRGGYNPLSVHGIPSGIENICVGQFRSKVEQLDRQNDACNLIASLCQSSRDNLLTVWRFL